MIYAVLFSLFFTSIAQAKLPELDPNKFTICAITINSDNEKNVFEEQVKKDPKNFNPIVELTEMGGEDWFSKACDSKVKCDQLIISGHFGGSFFGSSGKRLPLSELETRGCSKSCEGIMSQPYEIFLFGCNTLSTREKDHRTPEEYLRVLLNDGIPRVQAEFIVESRYGVVGEDNKSSMQRAFGGSTKQLYGFDSVGPSGKNVEGFLRNYFSKELLGESLKKLQAKRMLGQLDLTNEALAKSLKLTAFSQCGAGAANEADTRQLIICGLLDDNKSVDIKLDLVLQALSQKDYLAFIPTINKFLKNIQSSNMTPAQKEVLESIGSNKVIKDQILGLISVTKSISLLNEWLSFATSLKLINEEDKGRILTDAISSQLKSGLSIEEVDIICSLDEETLQSIDLTIKDVKDVVFAQNDYGAFICILPQDKGVQLKLLEGLKDSDSKVRLKAVEAFVVIKPQDKEVQLKLLEGLKDSDSNVRLEAVEAFTVNKPQDKEVQLMLLEGLKDADRNVRSKVAQAFVVNKPQDKEVQLKLLEGLKDSDSNVRSKVAHAFVAIKPQDKEVQLKLLGGLKDSDSNVWYTVANSFIEIRPQDKEVQLGLFEGLRNSDSNIRLKFAEVFQAINPQDKEVQLKLLEGLNDSDSYVRSTVAGIFSGTKTQDKEVQLKLVEGLKNSSYSVRNTVANILAEIKPQDNQVQLKIVEELTNPESNVSNLAAYALTSIKPQAKEVQLKLIEGLKNSDGNVRYRVVKVFASINPQDIEIQLELINLLQDPVAGNGSREILTSLKIVDQSVLKVLNQADKKLWLMQQQKNK
jgi:HEAT repeat protein